VQDQTLITAIPILFRSICIENVLLCDSLLFSDDSATCVKPKEFDVGGIQLRERELANAALRNCLVERERATAAATDAFCENSTINWFVEPTTSRNARFGCTNERDVPPRLESSETLIEFMSRDAQRTLPLTVRYTNKKYGIRFGVGVVAVAEARVVGNASTRTFLPDETRKQSTVGVDWNFRCGNDGGVDFVETSAMLMAETGVSRSMFVVNFSLSDITRLVVTRDANAEKPYNVSAHSLKIDFASESFVFGSSKSNRVVVQFKTFFDPFNSFAFSLNDEERVVKQADQRFNLHLMNSDFKLRLGSPAYAVADDKLVRLEGAFAEFRDAQLIYHTRACPAYLFEFQFERFNNTLLFDPDFQVLFDEGLVDEHLFEGDRAGATDNSATSAIVVTVVVLVILVGVGTTTFLMRTRLSRMFSARVGTE
jgi:hypothetical protein